MERGRLGDAETASRGIRRIVEAKAEVEIVEIPLAQIRLRSKVGCGLIFAPEWSRYR
jgi:hypothetical protein